MRPLALIPVADTLLDVVTIICVGGNCGIVEEHKVAIENITVGGITGRIFKNYAARNIILQPQLLSHKLAFFQGNMNTWGPVINHQVITCKM